MKTRLTARAVALASVVALSLGATASANVALSATSAVTAAAQGQLYTQPKKKDPNHLRKVLKDRSSQIKQEAREVSRDTIREGETPASAQDPQGVQQPAAHADEGVQPVAAAEPAAQPMAQAAPQPAGQPAAPAPAPGAPAAAPAIPVQAAPLPASAARLVFENPMHDFGVVQDATPLVTKFKFTNKGTEKLVINAINTGCGCTAAKMPKQEFEPGESGEIEITYNPKGAGKQQRAVNITSNDGQNPNLQLTIAAQVIPLIEARPQNIQFGQVSIGEARTVQLVVVSRDKNMKITDVSTNGPDVEAKLVPEGKPQVLVEAELPGVAVIDVTLKDNAAVGRVMRQVTVKAQVAKSDGESQTEQELKVFTFGQVQGELTLNPQQIRVAPTAPGVAFEREVIVTRRGNAPFNIVSAEVVNSTLPGVQASIEPWSSGELKGYKVKMSGTTAAAPGNFRGSIMLTTDVEREKSVEVQFSGIIRSTPNNAAAAAPAPGANPGNAIPLNPTPTSTTPPAAQPK